MVARRLRMAALATLLGCGGGTATTPTPTEPEAVGSEVVRDSPAPSEDAPWLLEATATAPSRDEAYRAAHGRLAVALYGSEAWAAVLDMPVHDRARDPMREAREGDAWRVHVGLERARATELLERAAHQPLAMDAPPPLSREVRRAQRLALLERLCDRRAEVLQSPCGPDDPVVEEGEVDAILSQLAASLRLAPRFDGGVPLDARGKPIRPVAVRVTRGRGEPVAGLPLVVESESEPKPKRALTDPEGTARFTDLSEAPWNGPLRVAVDAERLVGPLADRWPGEPVRIEGRPLSLARWAALVVERAQGANAGRAVVTRVLERAIREHTGGRRVKLTEAQADRVRNAQRDPSALEGLADALDGRLDVVLWVEVDSEFASRMGAQRVWYEARGRVVAFDAWTGERLTTVRTAVTESGVGEGRADEAARGALARALVEALLSELKP